jgi:hypothetical protein
MRARGPLHSNADGSRALAAFTGHRVTALLLTSSLSCTGTGAGPEVRRVLTHSVACGAQALAPDSELELFALGDFPPDNRSGEVLRASAAGKDLLFSERLRALTASTTRVEPRFFGQTERQGRDVEVLLWPERRECVLAPPRSYPAPGGGQAAGYSARHGLVLIAGGNDAQRPAAVLGALAFSTHTGSVRGLEAGTGNYELNEPRAFATVTPFGDALLVAGGENPLNNVASAQRLALSSAEVLDVARGSFEPQLIELEEPRTRHAAIELPNGDTLLVGGRGAVGDALTLVESVSVANRRSTLRGLAQLSAGRIAPSVLRLADGRLLVSGGNRADGKPVELFEWLSPDATERSDTQLRRRIPGRYGRAFVAMPGGGALAVGGCEDRPPRAGEDCAAECQLGCPPDGGYDGYWVGPDGSVSEVALEAIAPRPLLLAASDGRPYLLADSSAAEAGKSARVYRFEPFRARFEPELLEIASPDAGAPAPIAIDKDAFVWLAAEDASLRGMRLGLRSRYATDVGLVIATRPDDPGAPLHLAPDRAPGRALEYDGELRWNEAGVRVVLTDVDFADVRVTLKFAGEPPELWLSTHVYGETGCRWPEGRADELSLTRIGGEVELARAGARRSCAAPDARVSIAVGGRRGTRLLALGVERLPEP